jgi:hypothetical protein
MRVGVLINKEKTQVSNSTSINAAPSFGTFLNPRGCKESSRFNKKQKGLKF